MLIAILVASIIIVIYLIFSFFVAYQIVERTTHPAYTSRKARQERNAKDGLLKGTDRFQRENIIFTMRDGYEINGDISINNPKKFVIFAHGHGSTREGAIKYTNIFYDLGYSLVLYDERGHGDNKRVPCTMGFNESKDLVEIVQYIKDKYGNDVEIGLFGYSMGGATVCLSTPYLQDSVKFLVVDCAFASLRKQCHNIAFTHFTPYFPCLLFVSLLLKVNYRFSFRDCNGKIALRKSKIPVCFFHGKEDKKVLPVHSKLLFKASNSDIKEIHLFENAGHSKSIESDHQSYTTKIKDFIKRIGD